GPRRWVLLEADAARGERRVRRCVPRRPRGPVRPHDGGAPADGSPRGCAVIGGTVGEAVRVSGIGLGIFAPAERRSTRYVDGGVALGLPATILPDFGADMVIGCNSIMPPRGRDLHAVLPFDVGPLSRLHPLFNVLAGRFSDAFVGLLTTLRDSARQGARDADVYYEVSP